jgi:signal peptidase II
VSSKVKNLALFAVIAGTVAVLSQLIGLWVNTTIPQGSTVELNSVIHFTHIRNFGGVFGMFQGQGWIFAVISLGLLLAVTAYLWFSDSLERYEFICFGFIVGGGISNILDRLIHGSVIDFIDIQHIPYWNYVFNTADVMVHVGIWPMLILGFYIESIRNKLVDKEASSS